MAKAAKRSWWVGAALVGLALAPGCSGSSERLNLTAGSNELHRLEARPEPQRVRPAAVAGLFYPGDERELSRTVDGLLAAAPTPYIPRLRALICPHAGYPYSGPVAAAAYRALAGRDIQTVIILAPSHYAGFSGACLPAWDAYRTPLGVIPVSEKVKRLISVKPFAAEPRCYVQRPAWWRQAPFTPPEPGRDTPDTWEHSVEVQIPFIQKTVKGCSILPIIFGQIDPAAVAKGLEPILDAKTIIVASSDLSHYHDYAAAKALDARCISAILAEDMDKMKEQEACGKAPIMALLHLAKLKGWKARLLEARNSGDATGDKERVVGYAGVAFYEPGKPEFGETDREYMLELARQAVTCAVTNGPEPRLDKAPEKLKQKRACFVTLTKGGVLRGCIGNLLPQAPLEQSIVDNARGAALRDPRFAPVSADELSSLRIEVSVLSQPEPLSFSSPEDLLARLKPHEDGVLLRIGPRMATFLPQVWAQVPDKISFLGHLCEKAGCDRQAWRGKDVTISIYHVECFEEAAEPAVNN